MNPKAHAQLRQSQVVTTFGPGALIDLPRHSAIVGGLNTWLGRKDEIHEPRLAQKLKGLAGGQPPRLFVPPAETDGSWKPGQPQRGVRAWLFPEWFLVQERERGRDGQAQRRRRLVHRRSLEKGRFEKLEVVPTRFVRACPRGHVDDIDWVRFAHKDRDTTCRRQLWLEERGTTEDLQELHVRCDCGAVRPLIEATDISLNPLGTCWGRRPWLGRHTEEKCKLPSRLLVRTASNAYFPQVVSALSLPRQRSPVETAVDRLWEDLRIVEDGDDLRVLKKKPIIAETLHRFEDGEVLRAIAEIRRGGGGDDRHLKEAELEAFLNAPEGFGDDVPINPDFHARRLPDGVWRTSGHSTDIAAVIQLHRLREVQALIGFTRFEAAMCDIHGEYNTDVERAALDIDPTWFPAIENRGEGIFVLLRKEAVREWLRRPGVRKRLDTLKTGHGIWGEQHPQAKHPFPGGPYILLHTLSHLLIQSLAMRCGYPASSIRERIYVEDGEFGMLLYTASTDAEGTLGGLVQQARNIETHLADALRMGELCSNDPVCSQHKPDDKLEERWLHGAACHGCTLISETSCEMRNDHLDRALVVPALGVPDAAFFDRPHW